MKFAHLIPVSIAALVIVLSVTTATPARDESADPAREESAAARLFASIKAGDAAAVRDQLAARPSLLEIRREGVSVVMAALFVRRNQFEFTPPAENAVLAAVLSRNPVLDIFEASGTGRVERVRRWLDGDPSLAKAWDQSGWTALHLAAFGGSGEATALLLQHGAIIDARARTRFRTTPLHAALLNGQYRTARLLLERGADVHARQASGGTCLHEAAFSCRRDLVELLLSHGATVNARRDDGRTPLDEARRGKCDEVAELLARKGPPR
jgi:uncharacterized protein